MQFKYKSQLKSGETKEGIIEAPNKFAAAKQIRDSGEIPLVVSENSVSGVDSFMGKLSFFGGVSLREKIMFTRNLSGMLQAGLPVYRALSVLNKQTNNQFFKKVLDALLDTINKGGTLSEGMQKYPKVFSPLFVSMVRAGEESGGLSKTLSEIGGTLQKTFDLNKKIKSALTYPSIIVSAMLVIGGFMLVKVVPTLSKTFLDIGAELPAATKLIIWLSESLKNNLLMVIIVLFGFIGGCILMAKMKGTQKYFDFIILHLPVIGTLTKEVNTARTARTLSSLLSAGVPMSRALSITKEVLQNVYYQKILGDSLEAIEKGKPLSVIFKDNIKYYPMMVGEMMEVGEETGNFASMLMDIATFYEGEVDAKTKDLSTIIEPVLMVVIGGAVGFFAMSMITPMYSILDSIQ
jgi:type IV pilus assembly protein PilC